MRTLLALAALLLAPAAQALMPFPIPAHMEQGNSPITVASALTFSCSCEACASDVLVHAFSRYKNITGSNQNDGELQSVEVCVTTNNTKLGPDTDESYRIAIPAPQSGLALTVKIGAASVYGALHGLEVMAQLVDTANHTIPNAPVTIFDRPRFPFRGLMVDTARHFLPIEFLKKVVDGLHANRLNVLHWHIVDSQSFPCGSDRFPELAQKGAWDTKAIYSPGDMRGLVEYARLRGVRVMPEWDIPGHGRWGKGMPSIMGCEVVLDPTQDATYEFLNDFLGEMMSIFTDEYVFLGGDEVQFKCWDQNPKIAAWLKAHSMNSSRLQQYFWEQVSVRVLPKALAGRTVSIWEADNLQIDPSTLPKGTVANVYQSKATADITVGEYKMPSVVSIAGDNWYLDSQCSGYNWNSWICRYNVEPTSNVTKGNPLFLGGEGAMWGEGINQNNFDAYVWHGAAAIAERLWSVSAPAQENAYVQQRLAEQMCRMASNGFRPGPVLPSFCPADL